MTDVLSIALSGLTAQKQRLAVTASNVANASTGGKVPSDDPSAPASTVYKPLQVNLSPVAGGQGVTAEVTEKENGYSVIYDPNSADANTEGLVAVPNVDLVEEAVKLTEIKAAYKANLSVIKTQDEMTKALLDTVA